MSKVLFLLENALQYVQRSNSEAAVELAEEIEELIELQPRTNIGFVNGLMEGNLPIDSCPAGMLVQPFVLEALSYYGKAVVAAGPEASDTAFLSGKAWVATAEHVVKATEAYFKSKKANA
jgi:hypothetical protein